MTDVTRHEMNATLAASEARVAAAVDGLKAEFSTSRAESRAEMAEFRAQIKDSLGQMTIALAAQSKDFESQVSGLKLWVLGGALSGAVAVLLMLGAVIARGYLSPAPQAVNPPPPAATN